MRYSSVVVMVLLSLTIGCGQEQSSPDSTGKMAQQPDYRAQFSWLADTWQMDSPRGTSYESWQADDSGFIGRSFYLDGADTVVTESLWLRLTDSKPVYVALPRQNTEPTRFTLIAADSATWTFENTLHDFPTRIAYRYQAPDSMTATISGPDGDSIRHIDFQFERVR